MQKRIYPKKPCDICGKPVSISHWARHRLICRERENVVTTIYQKGGEVVWISN